MHDYGLTADLQCSRSDHRDLQIAGLLDRGETMARRLTRFASILGLLFLAYGIGWLAIWNGGVQGDSGLDWLPFELSTPVEARLMIVGGLLLLLAAGIIRLIGRVIAGKGSAGALKP
jgi:hypothetical protein